MVRRNVLGWSLAALALVGAGSASASQVQFTGNVAKDFPEGQRGIGVIVDNPDPVTGQSNPNDVAQAAWITQAGHITGWNMKDLRMHYDAATDTLAVGINFFGIAGDADGNGIQGVADPRTIAAGGVEVPHLGGRESITVGIALNGDKTPDIVAGVPADKTKAGPGIDGFTVAKYDPVAGLNGIEYGYGATLKDQLGGLAFDPSAAHPGFEFLIKNVSKIPGFQVPNMKDGFLWSPGFSIEAFAGSPDDVVAGEDFIPMTRISPEAIPEPATLLAWSVVAAGAAWRVRRRRAPDA
jgi:hypothetical protein